MLVMTISLPWYRWPIEIDGLPFLKMGGSFHGELLNNQMVRYSQSFGHQISQPFLQHCYKTTGPTKSPNRSQPAHGSFGSCPSPVVHEQCFTPCHVVHVSVSLEIPKNLVGRYMSMFFLDDFGNPFENYHHLHTVTLRSGILLS